MPEMTQLAKASNNLTYGNECVVRQSPAGKNVSTEAENIVEFRHQATTDEDAAD
jgi:hypothetical protein